MPLSIWMSFRGQRRIHAREHVEWSHPWILRCAPNDRIEISSRGTSRAVPQRQRAEQPRHHARPDHKPEYRTWSQGTPNPADPGARDRRADGITKETGETGGDPGRFL